MQNTVATGVPLQPASELKLEKCNGIFENSVANDKIPLQNQPSCNGIEQNATLLEKIPLRPSVSEELPAQIQPQRCDACNAILHTSWKRAEVQFLQSLGMTKEEAVDIWDKQGRPIIPLGPGENCCDLGKLLAQEKIKPEHLLAIRAWLEEH
jgi:hypothetical protein